MANRRKQKANVLHLTTGGNCCGNGQRIPAVHVQNKKFHISTSLNGNGNSKFKYKYEKHQKYHIVIQQSLENGLVMYKIIVDGEVVYSQQNNQPQNFNNVMAYVSDPWSDPFDGCLENLELTPGSGKLSSI